MQCGHGPAFRSEGAGCRSLKAEDLLPGGDWPAPQLSSDQAPDWPVLASVEYWARPGLEDKLMTALQDTRFNRRRTGATSWRAWSDSTNQARVLEQFVVASWDDHLRQHERVTKRDQQRLDRLREMTDPAHAVAVTHWLAISGLDLVTGGLRPMRFSPGANRSGLHRENEKG